MQNVKRLPVIMLAGRHVGALPYAAVENQSTPLGPVTIAIIKYEFGLTALGSYLGVPGNVLVILVSLFNKQDIHDYKICLISTSLLDVVFGIIALVRHWFFEALVHYGKGMTPLECSIFTWSLILPGLAMVYALPLVS